MDYHTIGYLFLFLPAVLCVYQLMPKKARPYVLLTAGYVFFWLFSGWLVVFLIGSSLFTHFICEQIVRARNSGRTKPQQKRIAACGIIILLGILGYLKYYNFFASNLNKITVLTGAGALLPPLRLVLPIGISFYTLEAIGLMLDVFWERAEVPSNPARTALFLAFFPKMMEGPICRHGDIYDALWEGGSLRWENLTQGAVRILWGLFKKVIIADRLDLMVKNVFNYFTNYQGAVVAVAAVAYTVQLYMEFSGCIDIVIGSSKMFGITLPENFRRPFFSKNAAEFWRRWHISLGTWLKTYVFYPVSLSKTVRKWNRFGRKHLTKYWTKLGAVVLTLLPVWLCNGLWHGAKWNYIFFGVYYFVVLTFESALEPARESCVRKLGISDKTPWYLLVRGLKTWIIIFVGELFFRADGVRAGLHMLISIFRGFTLRTLWDGSLLQLGLDKADFLVIIAGTLVVAAVSWIQEKELLGKEGMASLKLPVRWALLYGLILAVVIFGAYGFGYQPVDLIYAGF